jgi:hypothetical protein
MLIWINKMSFGLVNLHNQIWCLSTLIASKISMNIKTWMKN